MVIWGGSHHVVYSYNRKRENVFVILAADVCVNFWRFKYTSAVQR